MVSSLDHLVYAVPNLEEAVARIAALSGVHPIEGGPHPGLGTRNYLLGLGGRAYLEIIGPDPDQPPPEHPRPFGVSESSTPTLASWALAVHPGTLDTHVTTSRKAGYDPGEPTGMSRHKPDGTLLTWSLTPPTPGVLPFLIDWGNTPHPTTDLPMVPLLNFEITHPAPEAIGTALTALGAHNTNITKGPEGLHAQTEGPTGPFTLT